MSYTPGPWTVECDESGVFVLMGPLKGEDEYLAVYAAPIDGEASSRRVADARLIAAAPAMYELLLDVEWSSYDDQRGPNCPKCRALMHMGHYPECSLGAAIKAIRGEVEVQS